MKGRRVKKSIVKGACTKAIAVYCTLIDERAKWSGK